MTFPMALPTTASHPLQAAWDLAGTAIQAEALAFALARGLFDLMTEPTPSAELAARASLEPINTGHLLELLWSLGWLIRRRGLSQADRFEVAPVTRAFLVRTSPSFCGDALVYRFQTLRALAAQMGARIEQGPALPASTLQAATGAGWAAAARAQIGEEQRAITVDAALAIVERLPEARRARYLLDLGGGPGWVAIELLRRSPECKGVVFDWPETATVAQENIAAAGLAHRLQARGGNLAVDSPGEGFDLLWCSSVLHFVPDIASTLARLRAAMAPGGLLICAHAERSSTPTEAARVLPFCLPMQLLGRHVLREGEMEAALHDAGFRDIESFPSAAFPMAPLQVVIGRAGDHVV